MFRSDIFPVLTPLAVDPAHPFPYISGLSLNLAIELQDPDTGKNLFARVKIPETLPRFLSVDSAGHATAVTDATTLDDEPRSFVPLEDVIAAQARLPVPRHGRHRPSRVPRDPQRGRGGRGGRRGEPPEGDGEGACCAGALAPPSASRSLRTCPRTFTTCWCVRGITERDVFLLPEPLDLTGLHVIADLDRPRLQFEAFRPTTHHQARAGRDCGRAEHLRGDPSR
ncbi:hypothetical protein GCM10025876_14870 [Demequina litorisediminis]|uniref:Polyphosphate kinase middle domain-containing protein n=1 Tax=Demequina litorisediminis TaxID=1849022 RepID=A0ABQ6IET4_9MICO|nr:hypothetical protein GCM10025876_14870 [Demequina litorisediminis]